MANDTSNFLVSEAQLNLDEARRQKSERIKSLGSPIQLAGKALDIQVHGNHAWIAENTAVARKLDLESGKTVQLYKGHTGPVTALAFVDANSNSGSGTILITTSWDRSIRLWNTDAKELLSTTTDAHTDFIKRLFVMQSLNLLVSSGSDKIIRLWDLSTPLQKEPLKCVGSISSHTRPVECLSAIEHSDGSASLFSADTMGIIKVWLLRKDGESWRGTLQKEFRHHRTRVNEMLYGSGHLWTASADDTVQVLTTDVPGSLRKLPLSIEHPEPVRAILPLNLTDLREPYLLTGAGDTIRVYDMSSADEPELLNVLDAHWHDITAIRLWRRATIKNDGSARIEPWIITTSLDATIRKWRLSELLTPSLSRSQPVDDEISAPISQDEAGGFELTEDEERELANLMDSD